MASKFSIPKSVRLVYSVETFLYIFHIHEVHARLHTKLCANHAQKSILHSANFDIEHISLYILGEQR